MNFPSISIGLIVVIVVAYVVGARYGGLARKFGVA